MFNKGFPMRRLGYVVVIIVFCYSYFATGCFFLNREEQNEFHTKVEDLERYIVNELDEYIVFNNYDEDIYWSKPTILLFGYISDFFT